MNPRTDPAFIGRVEIPEYGLYALREKYAKEGRDWIRQTLYSMTDDTEIGHQASWASAHNLTVEGLLDNLLWKVNPEASKLRHAAAEEAFFKMQYAQWTLTEKVEFWKRKCHFYARMALDYSRDKGGFLVLRKEWQEENAPWNSPEDLQYIASEIMAEFGIPLAIGQEMLRHFSQDTEWRRWADQAQSP